MHAELYELLKQVARAGDWIHYGDVAPVVGVDLTQADERNRLSELLGDVSRHEYAAGRPLLSVVVVLKDASPRPGPGFFKLARELAVHNDSDDVRFFATHLRAVHEEWSRD